MDQIFRMPYPKWLEGARFLKYSSLESTWAARMVTESLLLVSRFISLKFIIHFLILFSFLPRFFNRFSDTVSAYESGKLAELLNIDNSKDDL